MLAAFFQKKFAGYLTVLWKSEYPPFEERNIPEIVDFNVLIKFRNRRVGTLLMDAAEDLIRARSGTAGIGVGLTADYGAAQRLYVKRGYVPDGLGLSQSGKYLKYGDKITINDELTLRFTKKLTQS